MPNTLDPRTKLRPEPGPMSVPIRSPGLLARSRVRHDRQRSQLPGGPLSRRPVAGGLFVLWRVSDGPGRGRSRVDPVTV